MTGNDQTPMTAEEMAAELKRFGETNTTSSAARQYRYKQSEKASGPTAAEYQNESHIPALPPDLQQQSNTYSWICSSCGARHTDAEIGNIHQSRFHFNQLLIVECPSCHGAAHNITQLKKIQDDEAAAKVLELKRTKRAQLATAGALILYLLFPGVIEFMLFFLTTLWVGPLSKLDMKTKYGALVIAGAVMVINTFTFGALGMGFISATSRILSYVTAFVITMLSVIMAMIIDKTARLGGGLFYRT